MNTNSDGCARALRAAGFALLSASALSIPTSGVHAAVVISVDPTTNMSCSDGICKPTAKKAVLNVTDLANLLAAGAVKVVSDSVALDIQFAAPLSWTSASRLTLDAFHSILFEKPMTVAGTGAVTIITNDGGSGGDFSFEKKGHIEFWDLNSSLIINNAAYALVSDIALLASGIRGNPAGKFALAQSYDARNDGTYSAAPVLTLFTGTFEGLGNRIDHLSIKSRKESGAFGLFSYVDSGGEIRDIGLTNINIRGTAEGSSVAGLAPYSKGTIVNSYVTGKLRAGANSFIGGLAGNENGSIIHSHADISISADSGSRVGGLVALIYEGDEISDCYSTGAIVGGADSEIGGLVGFINGTVSRSFSMASVQGEYEVGGLVGNNSGTVRQSYSRGNVSGSSGDIGGLLGGAGTTTTESYSTGSVSGGTYTGGLVGYDGYSGGFGNDYWDLDSSGVSDSSKGAGNIPNDPGITGLTDAQLKSTLPAGFDPTIWRQSPSINNGYPYLLANPPPN